MMMFMEKDIEKTSIISILETLKSAGASGKSNKLWKDVYKYASKPKRQRVAVNLKKLDKIVKDGENVIVPGKVLAVGTLSHKFNIAAIEYSADATEKLKKAGCKMEKIESFIGKKDVRLII